MNKNLNKMKKSFADILDYPKDAVLNIPRITILGNLEIIITNHKGIVEYSPTTIRINSWIGTLKITGENLFIDEISKEDIHLKGKIANIEFSQGKS